VFDGSDIRGLIGRELRTTGGDRMGTIVGVYLDDDDGAPEWVTVATGLFGGHESFVPLAEARPAGDGVVVPYTRTRIRTAPHVAAGAYLGEADERTLYRHYGIPHLDGGPPRGGDGSRLRRWAGDATGDQRV
jgi:hypothetical protein